MRVSWSELKASQYWLILTWFSGVVSVLIFYYFSFLHSFCLCMTFVISFPLLPSHSPAVSVCQHLHVVWIRRRAAGSFTKGKEWWCKQRLHFFLHRPENCLLIKLIRIFSLETIILSQASLENKLFRFLRWGTSPAVVFPYLDPYLL